MKDNPAIRPNDPWLGTVGVRPVTGAGYEFGTALCLPRWDAPARDTGFDPTRRLGIGVWFQFDF